jgi:energy-coupling factor transporter ATP-binding protein EcfA2
MLGISSANIAVNKPVLMLAGANGAGKSSIAEAIKHALVAECDRVALKKEFNKLLHNGADAGHAIIGTSLGDYAVLLPEGKQTGAEGLPFGLEYCLSPARFAALTAAEKRAFLFKLMGVKVTTQAIIAKLASRGISVGDIDAISPYLASGFEAAHKEAQSKARDAKAAWRAVTGETYGAVKAADWSAPAVEVDGALLAETQAQIEAADGIIAELNGQLGALNEQAKNVGQAHANMHKRNEKLESLREHAGKFARIQDKLNRDADDLAVWEAKVSAIEGARHSQDACGCPACGVMLVWKNQELIEAESMATGTEDDIGKLPEYTKARDLLRSAVANGQRDLAAAENAARTLDELEKEPEQEVVSADAINLKISEVKTELATTKAKRQEVADQLAHFQQVERESKAASQKTTQAKAHHGDVEAWDFMADQLAPGGIPAELLSEALAPFNTVVEDYYQIAQWPRVSIDENMELSVGGRPYALRSESERWRADTLLALAIARISGAKVVVLDRFDVLDLQGRADALYLLDELAENGDVETAVLAGTLKAIPAQLPVNVQAAWVEAGVVKTLAEAA